MHKIKVKKTQYGINSTNELQHAHQIILRYLIDPHAGINRYPPLHYMYKIQNKFQDFSFKNRNAYNLQHPPQLHPIPSNSTKNRK